MIVHTSMFKGEPTTISKYVFNEQDNSAPLVLDSTVSKCDFILCILMQSLAIILAKFGNNNVHRRVVQGLVGITAHGKRPHGPQSTSCSLAPCTKKSEPTRHRGSRYATGEALGFP